MSRPVTLSAFTAGMTRLRTKGGASPETLYELTNCYVTASRSILPRPCHALLTLVPTGSKGLCAFNGVLYTFTADKTLVNTGSTTLVVLRHPDPAFAGSLSKIHFAQPMMGKLYVVAEFSDALVKHYWLIDPPVWQATHHYKANDIVQPVLVGNRKGLYFKAVQSASVDPAWTPNIQHSLADQVQPTVYNGFVYRAVEINGSTFLPNPSTAPSGTTEPVWPTTQGATVLESSSGFAEIVPNPPPTPPPSTPPGREEGGRFTNIGGTGGRGSFGNTPVRVP
jgi:hypothetical protein